MKIGILTQPLYNNYGGILQNYALQTALKRLGHEATTINFERKRVHFSFISLAFEIAKNILRKLSGRKVLFLNPLTTEKRVYSSTPKKKAFISKYINKTDVVPPLTNEWCRLQKYEAYVVGSDQVWRPMYSPSISNFFLDFTQGINVKRMSYAASFGVDYWEFPDDLTKTARECLKYFNGISVREKAGVQMCKDYLDVEAQHVLDPTMLLKTEDYRKLFDGAEISDEYILCYTLDMTPKIKQIIDSVKGDSNLKIKYVSGENTSSEDTGIEDWLRLISGAKYVVTDSFHGSVFSILFHRPFITIVNGNRGAERVRSLLDMFSLQNNLIDIASDELISINSNYGWEYVEKRLEKLRFDALEFIDKSLK